ncbi:MAG: patatin-like phospholipase family protein [Chloroflexi bacterium]|nr:patatin-like phospholipase family protein [Chloroflexota bacterium]MBP7044950.1 patatin-like phospholipase family protein [Chloroflexota bacterium]
MKTNLSENRRTQATRSKTAVVLAGGGLTGLVYEIGALRAVNDLLVDLSVNDFDVYVGTSAGALVSAGLANGVRPETMMQALAGSIPAIAPVMRRDIMRFNTGEIVRRSLGLPQMLVRAWSHYWRNSKDMTLFDVLWFMLEGLPSAFYDSQALADYVAQLLAALGGSNDFSQLKKDLFLIATNLENGERAVFSRYEQAQTPISQAVAASSALPMMYKPILVDGVEYVDGGLRGNASLDVAIEQGAKLVLCINPMVPYDNSREAFIPFLGPDKGDDPQRQHLSEKGLQAVANQVFRTFTHAGLHYHIKQLRRSHPDVDIILIEPRPDDYQMQFYNIMRFSARLIIAQHGYESVTLELAKDYEVYKEILARHGIRLSRRFVIEELAAIQEAKGDLRVVREVLEKRPLSTSIEANTDEPATKRLDRALDDLGEALAHLGERVGIE